ncbi:MAG: hypothetical protein KAG95_03450 [Bacteroidales bacterium]|nr:hypothetical protein [Bacteroidales bacterium]
MKYNDDKTFEELDSVTKNTKKGSIKDFIGGNFLTSENVIKQIPYVLFLSIIAIIYIGNRYEAEKILRETIALKNEVKELRAESITTTSELMYISKQSEVAKLVEEKGLDLKEAVVPPKKIIIEKE